MLHLLFAAPKRREPQSKVLHLRFAAPKTSRILLVPFLPALWFHAVCSIGFSVAVNVFWRPQLPQPRSDVAALAASRVVPMASHTGLARETHTGAIGSEADAQGTRVPAELPVYEPRDIYDPKDLYGNRDPPAAVAALAAAETAAEYLRRLPPPY